MMEAATPPGAPAPQDQLQTALDNLAQSVANMQARVNSDLDLLRKQVQDANNHPEVDLSAAIERITMIQETIVSIDAVAAVTDGGAPAEPAPSGDAASAPAAPDAPAQTGDQGPDAPAPDTPAPAAEEPPAPAPDERTVYTYDGEGDIDTTMWSPAGLRTEDGRELYVYSEDFAPGQQNGDGLGGVWHAYTGPRQPVEQPPADAAA